MFACWYPCTTPPKRVCRIVMSAARDVNQNFYAVLFVICKFICKIEHYTKQHFKVTHSHALNDEEIPKQDCRKANGNVSMKKFVILQITKHMTKSMIMKTMIAGRNTIHL